MSLLEEPNHWKQDSFQSEWSAEQQLPARHSWHKHCLRSQLLSIICPAMSTVFANSGSAGFPPSEAAIEDFAALCWDYFAMSYPLYQVQHGTLSPAGICGYSCAYQPSCCADK